MGCGRIESVIAVVDGSALEKGRAILLEPRPASKAGFGLPHSFDARGVGSADDRHDGDGMVD